MPTTELGGGILEAGTDLTLRAPGDDGVAMTTEEVNSLTPAAPSATQDVIIADPRRKAEFDDGRRDLLRVAMTP